MTRQREALIAAFDNWDEVLIATEKSTNAAGTAEEKYAAYMESTEAKLNQLTAAWEAFLNNLNASGAINTVIGLLTNLVNVLDFLINDLNLLKPALLGLGIAAAASAIQKLTTAITGTVTQFKNLVPMIQGLGRGELLTLTQTVAKLTANVGGLTNAQKLNVATALQQKGNYTQLSTVISNLSGSQAAAVVNLTDLNEEQQKAIISASSMATKEKEVAIATITAATAQKGAAVATGAHASAWDILKVAIASNPIGAIVTVLSIAVTAIAGITNAIEQASEKARQAVQDAKSEYESTSSELAGLNSELETTDKAMKALEGRGNLTIAERDELARLEEINAELLIQIELMDRRNAAAEGELISTTLKSMEQDYTSWGNNYLKVTDEVIAANKAYIQSLIGTDEFGQHEIMFSVDNQVENNEVNKLIGSYQALAEARKNAYAEGDANAAEFYEEQLNEVSAALGNEIEKLSSLRDNLIDLKNPTEESAAGLREINQALYAIDETVGEGNLQQLDFERVLKSEAVDEFRHKLDDLAANGLVTLEQLNSAEFSGLIDALDATGIESDIAKEKILAYYNEAEHVPYVDPITLEINIEEQGIDATLARIAEEFDALNSGAEMLANALTEVQSEGSITADTLNQLVDNGLLEYIDWTTNSLNAEGEAFINSTSAVQAKAYAELDAAQAAEILNLIQQVLGSTVASTANAEAAAAGAANALGDAAAGAAPDVLSLADAMRELQTAMAGANANQQRLLNEGMSNITAKYDAARASIGRVTTATQTFTNATNAANRASSGGGGSSKQVNEHTAALEAASEAAKEYADSLKKLVDEQKEHIQALKDQKKELQDARSAIEDLIEMTIKMLKQELKDQENILKEELDAVKDRYKQEKDALEDMAKVRDEDYKKRKKAIEEETKAKQALINVELEQLRKQEQEREHEEELAERRSEIAKIQDQIAALQLDDSVEAQKRRMELSQQLADAEKSLADYQHDYGVQLTEDALQSEMDRFEENQEQKLSGIEKEAEEYKKMHEARLQQLEAEYNRHVQKLEAEIKDIQKRANDEVSLRNQAIALIEGRSQEFYNRLIAWNRVYNKPLYKVIYIANSFNCGKPLRD